jgi:cytochrome c-type biogenesis protein CcmH/NrfF
LAGEFLEAVLWLAAEVVILGVMAIVVFREEKRRPTEQVAPKTEADAVEIKR